MIKDRNELKDRGIEIDLGGPQGNAFYLIGVAKNLSKQLSLDGGEITTEMMRGDYNHLLEVFEEHFGNFVTLYR
jgi:hypothetical protein